jgi:hypothetical protein
MASEQPRNERARNERHAQDAWLGELVRGAWGVDEAAAGLVRDLGEEGNPNLVALRDVLEEELVRLMLQGLRERGT